MGKHCVTEMEKRPSAAIPRRVCVVGATGRIGSWLVKKLLERDHIVVHATVRNIHGDPEKAAPLRSLPGAGSRLHLFEADLFYPEQIEQAVHGCEFVFLVAFPTKPFSNDAEREAATGGAMRSLKSILAICERSGSVKRVIYTGSVVATSPLDEHGLQCRDFIDESCWTNPVAPIPYPSDFGKFYTSVKTASEELLMAYGTSKEGSSTSAMVEVIILACGVVGGGALVDSIFGIGAHLSPLMEKSFWLDSFVLLQRLLCSVPLVHLDDACEAHIFCMDVPLPSGAGTERFLCASDYPSLRDIMAYYRRKYSELIISEPEDHYVIGSESIRGGSSKLKDMGFQYKYGVEETMDDSIRFAMKLGFVKDHS